MIMILIFGMIFFMIVGSYFTINNREPVPIQDGIGSLKSQYCTGCGDKLEIDNAYCSNCGIKIK